jgi:hypothetical protein
MSENIETTTTSNIPANSGIDGSHLVGNCESRNLLNILHDVCQQEFRPNGIIEEFEVSNIANLFLKKWWLLTRNVVADIRMMAKQSQQKHGSICTDTISEISWGMKRQQFWVASYFANIRDLGIKMAADNIDPVNYSMTRIVNRFKPTKGDFELAEPFNTFYWLKSWPLDVEIDTVWPWNKETEDDYNCQIDDHVRALLRLKGIKFRRRTTTRPKPPRKRKGKMKSVE